MRSAACPAFESGDCLSRRLALPQATFLGIPAYPRLALMAAVLAYALAKNHAFVDGNKRAAWIATRLFLGFNRRSVELPKDPWAEYFKCVAAGTLSREDLAGLLAQVMGADEPIEVD